MLRPVSSYILQVDKGPAVERFVGARGITGYARLEHNGRAEASGSSDARYKSYTF